MSKSNNKSTSAQMLLANKSILIITAFLIIVGCSKNKNCTKSDMLKYELLTVIIDSFAKPSVTIPPLVPEGVVDTIKNERDSILNLIKSEEWVNQKNIVAVLPYFYTPNKEVIFKNTYPKEFESLVKDLSVKSGDTILKIDKIKKTRGNIFIKAPTLKELIKDEDLWNSFDLRITGSKIVFDADCDKAVTIIGISKGRLNSYNSLVFLEKIDNNWVIVHKETISIS
ncbi:hypothetical protein SAMN04487906_0011 [Zhouia amylolytica]|uniref:Uncharacterized protein n=1 Tax=Zhouia amylolytica TaxID=376730 RepID=A0A1I6NY51_9FLAO|nr:hypothetical protein [Zhouia amylolytica]MCQ0112466.1 hypothetical protein [Zhouia amylolytica]SFS32861.1 hypothetical protein SAMN04487906_0011 [Zhouia amylolytica]